MALTVSFTISQSALTPEVITATDTSTGSDAAVTQRRIFFQNSQGQWLTEAGTSSTSAYESWSYADASESWTILQESTSLSITVQWLDVSDTVLYSLTQEYPFSWFSKNFFYYLIQNQALSPSVVQDTSYYMNLATLWVNIVGGVIAVENAADISASQNCFNRATYMQNNETKFF